MNITGERLAWLRLARTESIGPITFYRLLNKYKSATHALEVLPTLTRNKPITLCSVAQAERELELLHKYGGRLLHKGDPSYPNTLAMLEDAPPVLSMMGNPEYLNKPMIAIVGSRNASLNGRKLAHHMAADLGKAGHIITSGLARGIDTAAHEGALPTGTIAVVAGGIDIIYPKENDALYKTICDQGVVLSECPFGTQPIAQHFPKRNRIVSGLSAGIVVVEANLKSGSLITARMAAEQGRDVMAVPGFPLDPRSEGTNALIRDGATLVRNADDVVEQLSDFLKKPVQNNLFSEIHGMSEDDHNLSPTLSAAELVEIITSELSTTPVGVDEIIQSCNLRSADVQATLLEMELEGVVQRLPGNRVCLINEWLREERII